MKLEITVIALGPGDPKLLTLQAADALRDPAYHLIFRTSRHPVAEWLEQQDIVPDSMDRFYEQYENFDEMHQAMAAWLWLEAKKQPIALGVMDPEKDGLVAALGKAAPGRSTLRIHPGVSAASPCLTSLPPGFSAGMGLQLYTASEMASADWNPAVPLLVTELDSQLLAGEIQLRLSELLDDEQQVVFFPPADTASRPSRSIPLFQLNMQKKYDHTAALFVPASGYLSRERHTFDDLTRIVSRLRAPDGCPWDRVQTHGSLRPYMVEEAWEAVNAMDDGDMDHLADELGDVLLLQRTLGYNRWTPEDAREGKLGRNSL